MAGSCRRSSHGRSGSCASTASLAHTATCVNPAASGSEGGVRDGLDAVIREAEGRVLVTTFASNAARLQTLGRVAQDCGRTLCVAGRSLERIVKAAKGAGYLTDFPETVDFDTAMDLPRNKVLIIATGGQGEPRAALSRIAFDGHPVKLSDGDMVIFSSRQIPGNEVAIGKVQNALAAKGVVMITDRQADVHVSGHPGRPELGAMYSWIRPEILLPVHGEMRHMSEQARFGLEQGIPKAIVQGNGTVVRLAPDGPAVISHERTGRLVLDGDVILPADGATITERRRIANHGFIAVTVAFDLKGRLRGMPVVQIQGVPVEEDREDFIEQAQQAALEAATGHMDPDKRNEAIRLAVRRTATKWTGKKPIVNVAVLGI